MAGIKKVDEAVERSIKYFHDMGVASTVIAEKHITNLSATRIRQVILDNGWDTKKWSKKVAVTEKMRPEDWVCPTCKHTNDPDSYMCCCGEYAPFVDGNSSEMLSMTFGRNLGQEIESHKPTSLVSFNDGLGSCLSDGLASKVLNMNKEKFHGDNYKFDIAKTHLKDRVNEINLPILRNSLKELNILLRELGFAGANLSMISQTSRFTAETAGYLCRRFFTDLSEKKCPKCNYIIDKAPVTFYLAKFNPKNVAATALFLAMEHFMPKEEVEKVKWIQCEVCMGDHRKIVGCKKCNGEGRLKRFPFDERIAYTVKKSDVFEKIIKEIA